LLRDSRLRGGRARGVTAVELMTIVAVMIILGAIAIPWVTPVVLSGRLRGGAWQLAGDLRLARQMAVTTQKRHRICLSSCALTVGSGRYSLEREEGTAPSTYWVSATGGAATRLPTDVTVSVNTTGSKVTFDEKGMASNGTFTLSNLSGSYGVVIVVTGRVRVCNPALGSCP
jgi:Tfp pilus assembly protein FimT